MLGWSVGTGAVGTGLRPVAPYDGPPEDVVGGGGTFAPHAASAATMELAAIARSRARREIGRSLVTRAR